MSARRQWTREDVAEALRAFAREHGRTPRQAETQGVDWLPSFHSIAKHFGSMDGAREALDLPKVEWTLRWDRMKVIAAVGELIDALDRVPTLCEYREIAKWRRDLPGEKAIRKYVGTWGEVEVAVTGRTPMRKVRIPILVIRGALECCAVEHGEVVSPERYDVWSRQQPGRPCMSTVYVRMGSWKAAAVVMHEALRKGREAAA